MSDSLPVTLFWEATDSGEVQADYASEPLSEPSSNSSACLKPRVEHSKKSQSLSEVHLCHGIRCEWSRRKRKKIASRWKEEMPRSRKNGLQAYRERNGQHSGCHNL